MQVNGFFSAESDGSRDVNLAGSQLGLRQFAIIKDQIESKNLVEEVANVGRSLSANVARACEKSSRITGVRTVGTSSWIDTGDFETSMALYQHLKENGVLVKLNRSRGVMTKPALTLSD